MKRRLYWLILLLIGVALLSGCTTPVHDTSERIPTLVIHWYDSTTKNCTNQINFTDISDVPILGRTVMEVIDAIPDGDTNREQTITQSEWDQIERRFELLRLISSNKSPTSWSIYIDTFPFWIELIYIIPD
ncbi:MAG: hypothetical protein KAT16_05325 [Candidatus Heimdallarchaeota archaeon]|nr:hypothetical protein [Candidatus Heimdallarchaeota archaeon]